MRTIRIPKQITSKLLTSKRRGRALVIPLYLGWDDLNLTEHQLMSNCIATAYGKPIPYPDRQIVKLELEYPDLPRHTASEYAKAEMARKEWLDCGRCHGEGCSRCSGEGGRYA